MNEVSTKVFAILLRPLKSKGLTLDDLAKGTTITAERLRNPKERIDWPDYVTVMRNLRPHFSDQELVETGRSFMHAPGLRFGAVIARLLFSPMDFYRWANKPRSGFGNQMFSCITPMHRELSASSFELDLTLPEGYEVSWEFFLIAMGNMEEVPRLFGLPRAKLALEKIARGGRFHVVVPERTPILARIWRALTWPFTARSAARELKAAHETLLERYEELEAARGELAEYQANLERLVQERTAELRQARDQLSETVVQLRAAQGARERFFGNVSHEIRTPLALILLAAGDIETRAGDALDERARQSLDTVRDSARKLVRLVDELLLLAAGQEDKLQMHPEPTDLAALVRQLVASWRPATEAAGLEMVETAPAELVVQVDPVAIERVVSNLLSNAVKFTPRGGRVEVALATEQEGVRLSVVDTGPGIPAELAGRLFGRFERAASDPRRTSGTGIGLSLVKQLVEAHGGTVQARPGQSVGTELRVMLPASCVIGGRVAPVTELRLDDAAAPQPAVRSGARFDPPGVSAGTVLVAEDDARLAESVARLLAERYTVHVALDGEQALELVMQHQPQLLVTDVDMPGMSGIELSRRFREATGDRLAPVIILSAVLDLGTRLAGLEAGASDYVTKPFDPRELVARVDAQFRNRELAVRVQRAEQLSSLGILTAGLAHELRNPANGIVNAVAPLIELLPTQLTHPDTPVGQLLAVMASCAEQIAFLSRQLLGFRSGSADLDRRPAKIADLVGRAVSLAKPSLNGVDLRNHVEVACEVRCAAPLLVQALTNLIENAGHAAGSGGWVEVSAEQQDGRIMVQVTDSGRGVPVELRERVFEPFFTTKAPGSGTGLGLSVSRAIVHRHQGRLEIRERGGRAAFVMDLPLDTSGGALQREVEPPRASAPASSR